MEEEAKLCHSSNPYAMTEVVADADVPADPNQSWISLAVVVLLSGALRHSKGSGSFICMLCEILKSKQFSVSVRGYWSSPRLVYI
jgi:hypothetical protein